MKDNKDVFLYENERLDRVNEDIDLIQKKDGLMFGTDALLLSAFVRGKKSARAADLGCGTGIISLLLLARNKCKSINAVDVQSDFCDLAKRNASINGMGDRMTVLEADARDISQKDLGGEVDFVVCNPPYMKDRAGKANASTSKNIARHELYGNVGDFAAASARILKFGGLLYIVYRPDRMCDLLVSLRENSLEPKRIAMVYPDSASVPSMMLVEAKLGGSGGSVVTRPLIVYRDGKEISPRVFTPEMQSVYDTGNLFI